MFEYHIVLLVLLGGTTLLSTVLSVANVRHGAREMRRNADWLDEFLDIDGPSEIIDYQRAATGLGLIQSWVGLALLLGALYTGVVTDAVEFLDGTGLPTVAQGVIFFFGLFVAQRTLSVPFDLYSTFVIDEQFEFNETSPRLWLRDLVVGVLVSGVILGVVAGALLVLIETFETALWVVSGWVLIVGFMLFMQVLYPRVIAPLFNDFEPIEKGDLRDRVEAVFDRAGFEAEEIYTMDASRRSSRLNAYFIGFGRAKRVVLFDTLVEKLDGPEVEGVLAHELAHWKRNHVWKRTGATALQLGVVLAAVGYLLSTEWLYELFELPEVSYAGLFVAVLFVMPLLELTAPIVNKLSLAHEREADSFAVDVMGEGEPMVGALSNLAGENLSNPFPHPWYAAFNHQHPPIPERIRLIQEEADEAAEGETTSV
ncbi:M48 family metallopeptidase [Halovenus salina]|uniref:M48 family metallopeptidase n=1 Tax=Halovenus salina TaxID=1510225 RepID=UPI002260C01B|nr:M48 family metallopeptidase [Halovenus salina]